MQGHPRPTGHSEGSDKLWSTGGGNGNLLQYSWEENLEPYKKGIRYDTKRWASQLGSCLIYWERAEGND